MRHSLLELLPELLELVLSGLVALVLSVAGVYLEHFAFVTIQGGQTTVGFWAVVPGAVCLGFGYVLATDKVVPRVRDIQQ